MARGPYSYVREIVAPTPQGGPGGEWRCEYEMADSAAAYQRRERLSVMTTVKAPLPPRPRDVELAVLRHVRDLLNWQIQALEQKDGH